MTTLVDAPTDPAAAVASARETVAAIADTLWAAARPEDLLAVTEEIQALRSTLAAVEARVAVEVEAGEHLLEVLDPDGTARTDEQALDRLERSGHLGRFMATAEDGIGGVRLRGRGTVEDATLIKTALFALAAPQPGTDPDTGESARDLRDHGARC